jgi:hypothetical protein
MYMNCTIFGYLGEFCVVFFIILSKVWGNWSCKSCTNCTHIHVMCVWARLGFWGWFFFKLHSFNHLRVIN